MEFLDNFRRASIGCCKRVGGEAFGFVGGPEQGKSIGRRALCQAN